MRLAPILTLLPVLGAAFCVSPSSSCAGWEAIQTDQAQTLDWLAAHDPAFLRQVTAHDEFGAARGCWG